MQQTESFGERLKRLRLEKNLSTRQLAELLYVSQPTITRWETGERLPDINTLTKIAECLDIDPSVLLSAFSTSEDKPVEVIIVDDEKIILTGGLHALKKVLPKAKVTGFNEPAKAIEYANQNRVQIAFLDIEMGTTTGFDVCKKLLEINPNTNVIYLTAFPGYSLEAWSTGACGYMVKPLSRDSILKQVGMLKYPIRGQLL